VKEFHFSDDFDYQHALSIMLMMRRPFRVERTGSSFSFVNDRFAWIVARSRFWPKYLRELSVLKADIKHNTEGQVFNAKAPRGFLIQYEKFGAPGGEKYATDELDLSQAYLSAALKLRIVSPKVHVRMSGLRKAWRLRLLGAIARKKSVIEYDAKGDITGRRVESDRHLRGVWFAICCHVDNLMGRLALATKAAFLFYWYDNLFAARGGINKGVRSIVGIRHRITAGTLRTIPASSNLIAETGDGRRFFLPVVSRRRVSVAVEKFRVNFDADEVLTSERY
jgi:hypothetical protein